MSSSYKPDKVEAHEHSAWEGAAPLYVEHIANLTANSGQLELIRKFVGIGRTDRVLDVGCGPGVLTAQLRECASAVTGVDFSAEMIAEAQRHNPGLDFQVANAEDLPFADDTFDLAVVNYCAHHLARPERALREIQRVLLASGGRLAIVHPIQSRQRRWQLHLSGRCPRCSRYRLRCLDARWIGVGSGPARMSTVPLDRAREYEAQRLGVMGVMRRPLWRVVANGY